jgi:hypothetical protein
MIMAIFFYYKVNISYPLTFSRNLITSFHDSSLSMLKTSMNAFDVEIESACIAGNEKEPLVSRMSSVRELKSGKQYSPR